MFEPVAGETPIGEISGLIPQGVRSRAELSAAEAENIRRAVVRYLSGKPTRRQAPFTLAWLYKLHGQMFGEVWRWAGIRRTTELNIGVPAQQIDERLQNLLDDLNYWSRQTPMPRLEQSARLHHRAVQVHPFLNGNGRWARLLANIWLRHHGEPTTAWPDQAVDQTSVIREEYLSAIRAADQGDIQALLALHQRFTRTPS